MLTIRNLAMSFDGNEVLSGIDLTLAPGELFALLGPSGSGKSTVLRSVAGLESPTRGEIIINDRVVYSAEAGVDLSAEQRGLGMVFQSYALWPHLTVRQNVELPLRTGQRKVSRSILAERVRSSLAAVELEALAERPIPQLSGGQQQRVALARALAVEPKVMLMDEPLSNLDARLRESIREEIRRLVKRAGITVLYVTHDQEEAMAIADRIAIMADGRVRQVADPRTLYAQPNHPRIAAFLGDVNWVQGRVNGQAVHTSLGDFPVPHAKVSGDAIVGLRPESITLHSRAAAADGSQPAVVESVSFQGPWQLVRLRTHEQTLLVRVDGRESVPDEVWWRVASAEILLYPATEALPPPV